MTGSILTGEPQPGDEVRLRASHCTTCDRWEFPVRSYCPACGGKPEVDALGPAAVVVRCSAVLHQPPGALIEAPYTVALAAFPEGLTVMGVVQDVGHEQVRPGDRVRTVAATLGESLGYQFRLDPPS